MRFAVAIAGLVLMLMITACGTSADPTMQPTSAETATPNEVLVTPDVTRLVRDLPPTWTPTNTPTVTPTPTMTHTPTITPSPTPLDIDAMCDTFTVNNNIEDGATYTTADTLRLTFGIPSDYSTLVLGTVLNHDALDMPIADFVSGGADYASNWRLADFPHLGQWDYRVGVFILNAQDIHCVQEGSFVIEEAIIPTEKPNLIPTAMPFPSATPVITPTATIALCNGVC